MQITVNKIQNNSLCNTITISEKKPCIYQDDFNLKIEGFIIINGNTLFYNVYADQQLSIIAVQQAI